MCNEIKRPGSLAEMDRLIREIRNARSRIRFHRSRIRISEDETTRQSSKEEIYSALCSIESAAACLMSDASTAGKKVFR